MQKPSNQQKHYYVKNTKKNRRRRANKQACLQPNKEVKTKKGIIKKFVDFFKSNVEKNMLDPRQGKNIHYTLWSIISCCFAIFFFQAVSMRMFYNTISRKKLVTSFINTGERQPTDNHIRKILDKIPWMLFTVFFYFNLKTILNSKKIDIYYALKDKYLIVALDGSQIIVSNKIWCDKCSTRTHKNNGVIDFHHTILAASIIGPYSKKLAPIPLPFEPIEPQDGQVKQDCERNAIYRWVDKNIKLIKQINCNVVFLGDDIYACQNVCNFLEKKHNCKFIFTCKFSSHKYIEEFIQNMEHVSFSKKIKNDKYRYDTYNYKFYSNVPIKDPTDDKKIRKEKTLEVNVVTVEFYTKNKDNITERKFFSYITNINPDELTLELDIAEIINIARTRWDIEDRLFNVMKNKGYNLEHNYGHGKNYLLHNMILLNLLAYSLHVTISILEPEATKLFDENKFGLNKYLYMFISIFYDDISRKICKLLGILKDS